MSFKVHPYIWDKKIGTIIYDEGDIYFEYDNAFRGSGLDISPLKLPLDLKGVYTNKDERYFAGLAGVFHDSLPDKFGTKVIERYFESKGMDAYELNAIQKLMFVGDRGMGAISYRPAEDISQDKSTAEIIDIQKFYENSKKIVTGEAIDVIEEMLEFMESSASAGGARAKAIIGFNPLTNEMTNGTKDALPKGFEHWLIKFDEEKEGKSLNYTKLEYLYMSMAKECGIDVPEIKLFEHNHLSHFLIKRFDRVNDTRIHIHTLAGLTHTDFNIPKHYSYDILLKLTLNLTGEQASVEEQFKRMVFNVIARNQDDHAKNFSFMMDQNGRWSISPAYDITYANGVGYTKNHQLSIRGKVNNFTMEDLLYIAEDSSIKASKAKEMIDEILTVVSTFKQRAKELEVNDTLISRVYKALRLKL